MPPFAHVGGDAAQPSLAITWQLMREQKFTLQLNTRRMTIAAKERRCFIEPRMGLLVAFLGKPIEVARPSPGARRNAGGNPQR